MEQTNVLNAQLLQEQQEQIEKEIKEKYNELVRQGLYDSNKIWPIYDGVTDFEAYLSEKPRIMWILKEPWDKVSNNEPCGGGFSIPEEQQDPDFINHISFAQQRIIYAMQSIRTLGKQKTCEMAGYWEMPQHLLNIAYINLSKMPGYSTSNNALVDRARPWADIVKKQISVYDPDVIILGNVYHIVNQLGILSDSVFEKYIDGLVDVYTNGKKLILNVYHPSYFVINIQDYAESMTHAIGEFYHKLNQ